MAGEMTIVHPKPGRTIFLPGGTHGFSKGPVSLPAEHAEALRTAGHVATDDEKAAADKTAAKTASKADDKVADPAS